MATSGRPAETVEKGKARTLLSTLFITLPTQKEDTRNHFQSPPPPPQGLSPSPSLPTSQPLEKTGTRTPCR